MKWKYFANAICEAGDGIVLKKFGQEYEIPTSAALDVLRGASGILPSEEFDLIGFTKEEIGDRRKRIPANVEYMTRHWKALARSREIRDSLINGEKFEGVTANV